MLPNYGAIKLEYGVPSINYGAQKSAIEEFHKSIDGAP